MSEKTALVTASYSGIGKALCQQLAARNINLVFLNRDAARSIKQAEELRSGFNIDVDIFTTDLSDQPDLRKVSAEIVSAHPVLDMVFANAGVLLGRKQFSSQHNELHFEVNTIAPYLLLTGLRPALSASGTSAFVVSGSGARRMAKHLDVAALPNPKIFKKMTGPYAQSKQAVAALMANLRPDFAKDGIDLQVVDLGPTRTDMANGDGMPGLFRTFSFLFGKPQKAADRLLNAALAAPRKISATRDPSLPTADVQAQLLDLVIARSV